MRNENIKIIDGGVGTEISRRGIPLHPIYWSATAHMTDPDTVLQIHSDFIEAGADIISANSFMAGRHLLAAGGLDEFEKINQQAIEIAKKARLLSGDSNLIIAGTLSPTPRLDQAQDLPRGEHIDRNFRDQAFVLADSGADILLVELLFDSESAASLLAACCETGLPVWAGISATKIPESDTLMTFRQPGKLDRLPHETFDSLIRTVTTFPLDVLGVMHTEINLMPSALQALQKHWKGPTLAYAKTGMATCHDWEFEEIINEEEYATLMSDWVDNYDLEVVGGCCGTTPQHIRSLVKKFLNT